MSKSTALKSHRFVVVYRAEEREIEGAVEIWRGWIERVPDPRQRNMAGQEDDRMGFSTIAELPNRIETLIARAGRRSDADTAKIRRPS